MAARDSLVKLNDKTVAIVGNFGSLVQMTMTLLTEQGADVALVGKLTPEARRYVDHLNDQREIYAHYGRAGVIATDLEKDNELQEAAAKVVHSFSRLDTLLDTMPCLGYSLDKCNLMFNQASKFLVSRPRSRYILLAHHGHLVGDQKQTDELHEYRRQKVIEFRGKNLTTNTVLLGLTEEYLLRKYPKLPSIKAGLEEEKKISASARLVEPIEAAAWLMFLASPLSQAVNGQTLCVDHGFL